MQAELYQDLKPLISYFYKWEKERPDQVFLRQPYGDSWKTLTFAEAGKEARRMVNALRKLGLKKGDHIAIISKNCYHWILADLAIMIGGYISTPFYANLSTDQVREVIENSDTKAAFVGKLDHWEGLNEGIPDDMPIIRFPHYAGNAEVTRGLDWDQLVNENEPYEESPLPKMDEIWTILFTSGTTGSPKGVVHDHENAALVIRNEELYNTLKTKTVKDPAFFSFLPLNHIAERTAVEIGALICGGSISFAESLETFAKNLQEVQPTLFFAVPRIWTKFNLALLAKMPQKKLDRLLSIPIVSSLVKKKIKKGLGLSRAEIVLTGASITPENLKQFYRRLGINLREVYGMTENFGGFTLMPENGHKPNTVGKPFPNCEGKIDPDTGEILMKVPWMMKGYYKEPELTAEVMADGWLHTGDKGSFDEEGYLRIIGRVKDAFKTSKGKFIVPTLIEDSFVNNKILEQICVAGLGIPQPIALVVLSDIGKRLDKEEVVKGLQAQLDTVNTKLHGHERVSTMVVMNEPWSPDNHCLTPTLKVRRGAIDERYMDYYLEWHEAKDKILWH